jgi:hypothetical protein
MRRCARCKRWSSCGLRCRTRCASSMCCAMRRSRLLRPIRKSKRPCANACAPSVREVRKQLKQQIPQASPQEAEQLAALDDYASGLLTALPHGWQTAFQVCGGGSRPGVGRRGGQPAATAKKGAAVSPRCVRDPGTPVCHRSRASRLGRPTGKDSNACTTGCSRSNPSWTGVGPREAPR